MFSWRHTAREALEAAPLTDFHELIREAKISDEDAEVLVAKFVHGQSNVQISTSQHLTLEKVNRVLKKSYDKVFRLL